MRVSPTVQDIPKGWKIVDDGYVEEADKVWIPVDARFEPAGHNRGRTVQGCYCVIRKEKQQPPKKTGPELEPPEIPSGWRLLKGGDILQKGDRYTTSPFGSKLVNGWNAMGSYHHGKEIAWESPFLVIRKNVVTATPEKQEKKKEEKVAEKMATISNPGNTGFFATLKASMVQKSKEAVSTTLAERITEIVIGRLPSHLQTMCNIVPKPIRVFLVSTAVYGVAVRFDIPGKDHVRDVSKYALDGSMYEAFRVFLNLLEPVFAAIRDMAPRELAQLVDEAADPPAKPSVRKPKDTPAT